MLFKCLVMIPGSKRSIVKPKTLLSACAFLVIGCAYKIPAYAQLDSGYRQQQSTAEAKNRYCLQQYAEAPNWIYKTAGGNFRASLNKQRELFYYFITTFSDGSKVCNYRFVGSNWGVRAILDKEQDYGNGGRILYKQEGGSVVLYKKDCSNCEVTRSVVVEFKQ